MVYIYIVYGWYVHLFNFLYGLYRLKIKNYVVYIMFCNTKFTVFREDTGTCSHKCNKLVAKIS